MLRLTRLLDPLHRPSYVPRYWVCPTLHLFYPHPPTHRIYRARVFNIDISVSEIKHDKFTSVQCDVSDVAALEQAYATILAQTDNRVDYLVANAGIHLFESIETTSFDDFNRVVNINLRGVFFSVKAVLPCMKEQKSGKSFVALFVSGMQAEVTEYMYMHTCLSSH